jgi:hypothetical protein
MPMQSSESLACELCNHNHVRMRFGTVSAPAYQRVWCRDAMPSDLQYLTEEDIEELSTLQC